MSAKIITIFSNKGGVGKTFAAVNIGTALAVGKHRVLMVDLDFQGGQDMARMINLTPSTSIVDILPQLEAGGDPEIIERAAAKHSSGFSFIPAAKNIKQIGRVTPDNIKPFFRQAMESYDYIIVDGGQTFSETLISVLDYSNLILLVATPDILAVYQIKWCLEFLQSLNFPLKMVRLILNRSESRGSVAWQEVRAALPCEIFGHIPSDGKLVGMAVNRGVPCVIDDPKTKVAESFYRMASALENEDMFLAATQMDRSRSGEGGTQRSEFWESLGVQQTVAGSIAGAKYSADEDEVLSLKRKIHERLIERLNLDGVTLDTLRDADAITRVRRSAQDVVVNLILEEGGGRVASPEERTRIAREIVGEALGLGPLEDFLADPEVSDIMVNNRNEIYVEKKGKLILTNKKFISDEKLRSIIDRIIAPLGRRIDESVPMVDARLPDGSRVNAIIPPLSLGGPMLTVRKFGQERLKAEDLLNKYHSFTKDMADFLQACVLARKNIIVSGGTGSGKTTLLNVISEFIPDGERILTIEDAAELQIKKSHWGRLESRPANVEGRGQITIRDLFINSLRMRPDRIVIGECRGPEVLDMLQAMNTGHDGSMTTLHANSARDVLTRMQSMILLSGLELPSRAINEMISSAIHIIVQIGRLSDGTRKVLGISEIVGLDKDWLLQLEDIFLFKQKGVDENGAVLGDFRATGYVPKCFEDFQTRGIKIEKSIFSK